MQEPAAIDWPYKYFSKDEMRCRCGECDGLPRAEFMAILERIREAIGVPLVVSSGYRCPKYNSHVSTTGENGPHVMGLAADIQAYGVRAFYLVETAIEFGMTGIGLQQRQVTPYGARFVHIDCVPVTDQVHPRPWIWSY